MKDKGSTVAIFMINGINSLLGWNAVLAALDYFFACYSEYNVYSFLPIPVFAGYLVIGSNFHNLSNKYKYITLITAGNIGINISLASILVVSIVAPHSIGGFIMLQFFAFLIGVSANLSQLSFFAMINYLSQDVVSKFTVGTAVSGLFITVVRMIILAGFGSGSESIAPIVIYFIIAIIFNTMDLFINIRFCKSALYKEKIDHFLAHRDNPLQQDHEESIIETNDLSPQDTAVIQEEKRIEEQSYFQTLLQTNKSIYPYPYIIMATFIITFTLFPGPSFDKKLDGFDPSWTVIVMLLAYNIGDTVGKYTAEFKGIFNKYSLIFIFFARLLFFIPITAMATGADSSDPLMNNYFFPFFNQLLFAITNGFCINASFIMAFKVCPPAYKKYAGVFCGLILQLGIIIGTIVEVPYSYMFGLN